MESSDPTIKKTSEQQASVIAEFKMLEESFKQLQNNIGRQIERKLRVQGEQLKEKLHYKRLVSEAEVVLQMTKAKQDRERTEILARLYSGSPNPISLAPEPTHPGWPILSPPEDAAHKPISLTPEPTLSPPEDAAHKPTSLAPEPTLSPPEDAAHNPTSLAPEPTLSPPEDASQEDLVASNKVVAADEILMIRRSDISTSAAPSAVPTEVQSEGLMDLTKLVNYGNINN